MLTFEQIKELLELVAERRLEGLKLERSGFKLKIDGRRPAKTQVTQVTAAPAAAAAPALVASTPAPAPAAATTASPDEPSGSGSGSGGDDELPESAHIVTAPLVGTFYRRPNPDAAAYVEVGSRVKNGQVLCIVEAMKLMNDVESDAAGTLLKIFPEDGQPVEYGQPLFAIEPA